MCPYHRLAKPAMILTQDSSQPKHAKHVKRQMPNISDDDTSSEKTRASSSADSLESKDIKRFEEALLDVKQHCDDVVVAQEKERAFLRSRMQAQSAASFERHVLLMESVNALGARLFNQPSAEERLEERHRSLQLSSAVEALRGRMSALEERADSKSMTRLDIDEQFSECRCNIGIDGDVPRTMNNASNNAWSQSESGWSDLGHRLHHSAVVSRLDDIDTRMNDLRTLLMERCAACEACIGEFSMSLTERLSDLNALWLSGASAPSSPSMLATPALSGSARSFSSFHGVDVPEDMKVPTISISCVAFASAAPPVASPRFLRAAPSPSRSAPRSIASPSKLAPAITGSIRTPSSGSRTASSAPCPEGLSAPSCSGMIWTPRGR